MFTVFRSFDCLAPGYTMDYPLAFLRWTARLYNALFLRTWFFLFIMHGRTDGLAHFLTSSGLLAITLWNCRNAVITMMILYAMDETLSTPCPTPFFKRISASTSICSSNAVFYYIPVCCFFYSFSLPYWCLSNHMYVLSLSCYVGLSARASVSSCS